MEHRDWNGSLRPWSHMSLSQMEIWVQPTLLDSDMSQFDRPCREQTLAVETVRTLCMVTEGTVGHMGFLVAYMLCKMS